jgi:hypothetical protein
MVERPAIAFSMSPPEGARTEHGKRVLDDVAAGRADARDDLSVCRRCGPRSGMVGMQR